MADVPTPASDSKRLVALVQSYGSAVVALSGGVDSSVVTAAAYRADPANALAVTSTSASVPQWQLEMARTVAGQIGIAHREIPTSEVSRDEYRRNDLRRCYHCKQTLYSALDQIARETGSVVISGTNADDAGDYRPGIQAGMRAGVRTPLLDLGIDKTRVRSLAAYYGLPNAELPASPCLASRIAYGVEVTPARLRRVERAESYLRGLGFTDVRVRLHADELARIEVPANELERLASSQSFQGCEQTFRQLGFRYVTVDLAGLRSGSLNPDVVSISTMDSSEPENPEAFP